MYGKSAGHRAIALQPQRLVALAAVWPTSAAGGADITLRIGRQHHFVALVYRFRHLFAFGDNDIAHFVTWDPRIRDHLKGPTLCVKITATQVHVWHNGLPGSLRQDL